MELTTIKAFYDAHEGLVSLDDDVHSIVSQVRERYGTRVRICWEPTTEHFVFSEHCEDGTERLIFTTPELDARALDRLLQADSQLRGYQDPYDAAEAAQDEANDASDRAYTEYISEATEHLVHALKREGKEPRLPLTIALPRGVNADRDG